MTACPAWPTGRSRLWASGTSSRAAAAIKGFVGSGRFNETMGQTEMIDGSRVQLVIVGKDPFPGSSTCIPFCKPDWKSQVQDRCSGNHVLLSLGVNLESARRNYPSPFGIFCALRRSGVMFLNAFHCITKYPSKRVHYEAVRTFYENNLPLLTSAENVLLCGGAKALHWIPEARRVGTAVVHPDVRCRSHRSPGVRTAWRDVWSPYAVARRYSIALPQDL